MPNDSNVANRTIFTADNLDILRGINSECIDLIYLDPPFKSDRRYAAPLDAEARGAGFTDVWTLDDMKSEWLDELEYRRPSLFHLIHGARLSNGEGMAGYLTFMGIRLLEMHRVLKDTGSIYLHCDDTAVHYLRGLMDAIFGPDNYLNNIVWRRATAHNDSRRFGRICDHILFYSAGGTPRWNPGDIAIPKDERELRRIYPSSDDRGRYRAADLTAMGETGGDRGRYRSDNLTAMGESGGESGRVWRGYDVTARGRHWAPPLTGRYAEYIERNFIPGYRSIDGVLARLDALDDAGLIRHPVAGAWPGLKRYAAADEGTPPQNLFLTPRGFTNYSTRSPEYTGWRTQKPLALLERIILASSNPDDWVLDPFCGCATACIAAEKLGRRWVGIDKAPQTIEVLRGRAARELQIPMPDGASREWEDWTPTAQTAPPKRTDMGQGQAADPQSDKELLYRSQSGKCKGCQYALPLHVLTIDHIRPRSLGGRDVIKNLQLLCHTCNAIKGNRGMEYLREELHRRGILSANS